MKTIKIEVWDLPIRLFHWLLVLAVTGAYISGELGGSLTDLHEQLGGLVLGLLIFRLIWGIIGSRHARFSQFFPTPAKLVSYFKGDWQELGHNPLGAIAVFSLLGILIFIAVSGLFANDDIAFEGPLFHLIDKDLSDKISGWHDGSVTPLLILLALHISAIAFYQFVKKADLLRPMLTGKKQLPESQVTDANHSLNLYRFGTSVFVAVFLVWAIWGAN